MAEPLNVLWTSGWDSTFRVAELVFNYGKVVQPHYVHDWRRPSTPVEILHQDMIRQEITRINPDAARLILPTKVHLFDDVPQDASARAQRDRLSQKTYLGGQYVFLSSMARAAGLNNLELCVHRDDQAVKVIADNAEHFPDYAGGYHTLAEQPTDPDLELFRPFRFPLFGMTKIEMEERSIELGFGAVMDLTWFCFYPTRKMTPCGFCNPCKYTRAEGLGRRTPEATLSRWATYMLRRKGGAVLRWTRHKVGLSPKS